MRDPRNEKFEKMRKDSEEKQLTNIRNHPHVPDDFDWRTYISLNPDVTVARKIDTEYLAVRHWIKIGRKRGLKYKIEDVSSEEMNVYLPEKMEELMNVYLPEKMEELMNVYLPEKMEELVQEKRKNTLDKPKGRKVIYTCISGNYDNLKKIYDHDEEWDYVCFTDSPKIGYADHWKVKELPKILERLDQTRRARALKILPHVFLPEYEEYIWIDGTIEILKSPNEFVKKHISKEDVFAIATHPDRDCVYKERDACIKYKKDDERVLRAQTLKYEKEGYPKNWGMVQSGIIYRKNTKEVKDFCNLWWEQVLQFSKRDQMSFNYILWKNPIPIKALKPSTLCSDFFWLCTHSNNEGKRARTRKDYDDLQNYINGEPV